VSAPDTLRWTIIANPSAGGFTINSRWKKHQAALVSTLEKAGSNPLRNEAGPSDTALNVKNRQEASGEPQNGEGLGSFGLIPTVGPGHAGDITRALVEEAEKTLTRGKPRRYLLITAGGDGTSLEVLEMLYQAKPAVRSRFAVLRLPMGTGNDGADAFELEEALKLLTQPVSIEQSRGLKLSTRTGKTWPGGNPFLAFNILSVGLDAFVTHMTNKMKGSLPGDSYKLWVDVASLLYDKLYKVGDMEVKGYDRDGHELISFKEQLLLCAMGVSGRRTYGSRKMILPDERNVCAIKQMPLLRKISLKELFTTGGHADKPESILWNASRISVSGEYPVLAQMDGETVLLEVEDFPAEIELTEPVIPVLKLLPNLNT
jgi:diacylglycerol kinase family enzyme